jgi:hypothetical protein
MIEAYADSAHTISLIGGIQNTHTLLRAYVSCIHVHPPSSKVQTCSISDMHTGAWVCHISAVYYVIEMTTRNLIAISIPSLFLSAGEFHHR